MKCHRSRWPVRFEAPLPKPDLVVLDIMLPGMDGVELLTRLRRSTYT
jgi:DNA-binding response OmpR family regulator